MLLLEVLLTTTKLDSLVLNDISGKIKLHDEHYSVKVPTFVK